MTKKHGIILAVIVLAILAWYGYKNWGWFGGTMNLRTAINNRKRCPAGQVQYFDAGSNTYGCRAYATA